MRNIEIVMSYRAASVERTENLYTVLRHLDHTYVDYTLWLMEADVSPRFDWGRLNDAKIRHVFQYNEGLFPKSLLYNLGVRLCRSSVICFHDADSIARPGLMRASVDSLLDAEVSDAICPYSGVINVAGRLKESLKVRPDFELVESLTTDTLTDDTTALYGEANGGIVFFRKAEYIRVGGYNSSLIGWGGEDDELLSRATRLGARWHSFMLPLIHLNHDNASRRQFISTSRESFNVKAAKASAEMPIEDLQSLARHLAEFFA